MARLIWTKAAALAAATDIAADIAEFFGAPAPEVIPPEGRDWSARVCAGPRAGESAPLWTHAGAAELCVDIDTQFAHLYFRFFNPARAVAFLGAGGTRLNPCSGKYNAIATPASYARDGAPDPATSLEVFRAGLRRDFRRLAKRNPAPEEIAAYWAAETARAARFTAAMASLERGA